MREWSPLATRVVGTSEGGSSSRNGVDVDSFIVHETAGGSHASNLARFRDGSLVTPNYYLSGGEILGIVPETRRAHTTGSPHDDGRGAGWDRRAITVEIRSWSDGQTWQTDPDDLDNAARLIADCAEYHGFEINADRVPGHRQLYEREGAGYPTACPGSQTDADLDELRAAARDYQLGDDDMTKEQQEQLNRVEANQDKILWLLGNAFGPALGRLDNDRWKRNNRDLPEIHAKLDEIVEHTAERRA